MKIVGYIFITLGFIGAIVGFISFFTSNILPSNLETGELLYIFKQMCIPINIQTIHIHRKTTYINTDQITAVIVISPLLL